MSIERTISVVCDKPGCDSRQSTTTTHITKRGWALMMAADDGWQRIGNKDFCPRDRTDSLLNVLEDVIE